MAEDRGAFKTNPAKPRPIPAIVMTRERRCSEASGPKNRSRRRWRPVTLLIF
jgi:hypothetical protein